MKDERTPLPTVDFIEISDATICTGMKCSNADINKWFYQEALKKHIEGSVRVTCAVEPDIPHRPLGFFALATVAEEVSRLEGRYHPFGKAEHFSALELVWLATDTFFEDRDLGKLMVGQAIRLFAQIGQRIGLPHLILVPAKQDYAKLVKFYGKLGFTTYRNGDAMFLSLQAAVDGEAKIQAAIQSQRMEGEAAPLN